MTTKSVEAVRDTILQFNHEHEGWPAPERVMAGGFDECLDCAESLARRCMAAHIEALTTEVERKDAALQAYLDAFDKGTGTVYVEPIIRAALQPQEKVG